MPFSDKQLLAVAEIMTAQFFDRTPRFLSDTIGVSADDKLGASLNAMQDFRQFGRDLHLVRTNRDAFENILFGKLQQVVADPSAHIDTLDRLFMSEEHLTGFQLHTNSRGGCTDLLREILKRFNIPNGYGDLPSIDLYCYDDGYVVFHDRSVNEIQAIPYEGFESAYRRIKKVGELSDCETIIGLNPKPFLVKKVPPDAEIYEIRDGKIVDVHPICYGQDDLLVISPDGYMGDINENDIDSNDPLLIGGIQGRTASRFYDSPSFSEFMDVVELNGRFYPKPVVFRLMKERVVCNEGRDRVSFEPGDYLTLSKGFSGDDYKKVRKYTQSEVWQLFSSGKLIKYDGPETASKALLDKIRKPVLSAG